MPHYELHGYTVTDIQELPLSYGLAWTCRVLHEGRAVGTAQNNGQGGCNHYFFDTKTEQSAFMQTAESWGRQVDDTDPEVEDRFVLALMSGHSYDALSETGHQVIRLSTVDELGLHDTAAVFGNKPLATLRQLPNATHIWAPGQGWQSLDTGQLDPMLKGQP